MKGPLPEKRLDEMRELLFKYAKANPMALAPLENEEQYRCLSCGRLVFVGRCCSNPSYIERVHED